MNTPWRVWSLFILSVLLVGAAMAWVSSMALQLEGATAEITAKADHEEKIRLSLWRLDSTIAPIIVEESSRPFFIYQSFYLTNRAYNRLFSEIKPGQVVVPSPLLTFTPENIHIHFQMDPEGKITSPQVPVGTMRDRAEQDYVKKPQIDKANYKLQKLKSFLTRENILAAIPEARNQREMQAEGVSGAWTADELPTDYQFKKKIASNSSRPSSSTQSKSLKKPGNFSSSFEAVKQTARGSQEFNARRRAVNRIANQQAEAFGHNMMFCRDFIPEESFIENAMLPIWVGEELILARRVNMVGKDYIQGCWIDWRHLEKELLHETTSLLPSCSLKPVFDMEGELPARMLASLPIEFKAGAMPEYKVEPLWSVRIPLGVAWACGGIAVIAVALLLAGVVQLSERRATFVSAVTHELRTPLTTFKMYTEMLRKGMVRDEEKRDKYLSTLQTEADRLGHMVENVLAFARLEKNNDADRLEVVSMGEFFDRVQDRLANRTEQVNFSLELGTEDPEQDAKARETCVRIDASTVEQILLNLVDNACKYSANSEDTRIHLSAHVGSSQVEVKVRDHGPGLSEAMLKKLFKPFSKSAPEAARSAPGVGLGLALSHRLARTMGGDLKLTQNSEDGAEFTLYLPRA